MFQNSCDKLKIQVYRDNLDWVRMRLCRLDGLRLSKSIEGVLGITEAEKMMSELAIVDEHRTYLYLGSGDSDFALGLSAFGIGAFLAAGGDFEPRSDAIRAASRKAA